MAEQPVPKHVREHGSLLAPAEKRALIWMAERLPPSVGSDHLTLLGLAAMLGAGLAYWAAGTQPLALCGVVMALAVNWFGDSLDGAWRASAINNGPCTATTWTTWSTSSAPCSCSAVWPCLAT